MFRLVSVLGSIAAVVLAGVSLTEADLVAGDWVRAVVVASWAAAGLVLARRNAMLGTVVAGAAAVGGICTATASSSDVAACARSRSSLIPAVALHFELVLPDGRIGRSSRRNLAIAGYVVAVASGVALCVPPTESQRFRPSPQPWWPRS